MEPPKKPGKGRPPKKKQFIREYVWGIYIKMLESCFII